ncbi:uncharacterized protein UTRI_06074_B [Ustilago trichophora]|uniref:Zn(2)-C6 fungal-type domain-containing protein n=1 Tax=Ustilago trichophora TaxID=86804 RepID=A0A5C3EJC6_9BASI|nr:uncharacterized protein UTRI_06074_B [Ustilago trichophora]
MLGAHSSASASASAPISASTSTSGSAAPPPPSPSTSSHPVKRRRYARRSCLTCRSKKTRCELPDESVPSSHDPLPFYKACHRCRALDIPCVVWDGDRKRKPRSETTSSSLPPPPLPITPPSSAYPRLQQYIPHSSRPDIASYQDTLLPSSNYPDTHAYPHNPSHPSREWHTQPISRRADLHERVKLPPESAAITSQSPASSKATPPTLPIPNSSFTNPSRTEASNSATTTTTAANNNNNNTNINAPYDSALFISENPSAHPRKAVMVGSEASILNNFCRHSPLVTLGRFISKIPSFACLLRPEMDRSCKGQLSSLLTDENVDELQSHLPRLRLWHPHIPDLASLRTAYYERPKPSTSLLIASVCLIASKIAAKRHLAKHFAVHVDRIGLQVLISAPKELHAAQAFELLLSHEPSLIGASVGPSSHSATDSAAFSESIHSNAFTIAQALGLDLALAEASQDADDAHLDAQERDRRLRSHLQRFSLWCSLSLWRAKFLFLNSVVRPYDFSRLPQDAHQAISLIDKLRPSNPAHALDDAMFKAGLLTQAYRVIQAADFHQRLVKFETLWHSRSLFSEVEVRREITSRVEHQLQFLDDLRSTKCYKLWSLGDLPELRFLDRWIDLEFESDWVFVFSAYMHALHITKGSITVDGIWQAYDSDPDLFRIVWDIGKEGYFRNERALAAFAATSRFEGESIDQTGMPLFLTCGYILHIAITVMEAVHFSQYGLHVCSIREGVYALIFPQLAERLSASTRSHAEGLDKLVASMLIQMSRRLDHCEYNKVIKRGNIAMAASPSQAAPSCDTHPDQLQSSSHASAQTTQQSVSAANNHLTPQSNVTPASDSSAVIDPNTPSLSWQDTPNTSQSDSARHGRASISSNSNSNSNTYMQSDRGHAMIPASNSAAAQASLAAAPSFPANAEALMCSSDPFSSENMARIMDQILAWDCVMPQMDSMAFGDIM